MPTAAGSKSSLDAPRAPDDDTAGESAVAPAAEGFKSELPFWLEPLRQSLAQLLREVGSPPTPRTLQHKLGVPYVACWQVFRIVRAVDATSEAQNAPSPGMLKGLLAAAGAHGATGPAIAAVAAAAEGFHQFVTRHAGDRSTFDSMVAETADGGKSETIVLQRRQAAYRAMSQLWGVQTDLQSIAMLLGPPTGNAADYTKIGVSLQRGVRRLRSDAQVTVMGFHPNPVGQTAKAPMVPLDPAAFAQYGMPILPAFSSSPLPKIEHITMATGWQLCNAIGGDVGRRSSAEFAVGTHIVDTPAEVTADGRKIYMMSFTTNRKPVALLVMDLLVHRASHPGIRPESIVHHHQEGDFTQSTAERAQRFPGEEKVVFAGRADALDLIEAPRYGEMLRYAAGTKKWDLAEFDAYRIRIPFPVLCSTTRIYFYAD